MKERKTRKQDEKRKEKEKRRKLISLRIERQCLPKLFNHRLQLRRLNRPECVPRVEMRFEVARLDGHDLLKLLRAEEREREGKRREEKEREGKERFRMKNDNERAHELRI